MRRLVVVGVLVILVLVFGVGQLVLPGLAANRLRDQLSANGQVRSVSVSAFPAIKLLWHHADKVVISLGDYRLAPSRLGSKLGQASDVGSLNASAAEFQTGLLTLRNASLVKHGNELSAHATVTEADLRSALPILQSVTPVSSSDGQITLQGTASLFGVSATVDAAVRPQDGNLIVAPNVPFGALATLTVFSDPHISVQSVSATPVPGGFNVQGTAQLH
ncbi:MAG: hypothetical protein WAK93_09410 [Solirubrobacteraceae bacterium]